MDISTTPLSENGRNEDANPYTVDPWLVAAPGSNLEAVADRLQGIVEVNRPSLKRSKISEEKAVTHLYRALVANVARSPDPWRNIAAVTRFRRVTTPWDCPAFDANFSTILEELQNEGFVKVDQTVENGRHDKSPSTTHVFRPTASFAQTVSDAAALDGPIGLTYAADAPPIFLSRSKLVLGPDDTFMQGLLPQYLIRYEDAPLEMTTSLSLNSLNRSNSWSPSVSFIGDSGEVRVLDVGDPRLIVRRCFYAALSDGKTREIKVSKGHGRWVKRIVQSYRLDHGGGFFGGFWRNLTLEDRLRRIRINEDHVAEVAFDDFSQHVTTHDLSAPGSAEHLRSRIIAETAETMRGGLPTRNGLIVPRWKAEKVARQMTKTGERILRLDINVQVYE